MGSYRFKWPHAAEEVIVTGTFDNWSHTIKLDKKNWVHEKVVEIPETKDEILYKFIVNGQWRTDPSHAVKRDHDGNENNILDPDDIIPSAGGAMVSSVGPSATTAGLAGQQPLQEKSPQPPGAFPSESDNEGAPSTLQDRVVGVNPIPASGGMGNPVSLKPGEKVPDPSTLTRNTVQSTVTTDRASYERGGAGGAAYSPVEKGDDSAAHFGRPPSGGTFIPESSSFMGSNVGEKDVTDSNISSIAPGATTTGLAGAQPIEPRGQGQVISRDADDNKDDGGISGKAMAGIGAAGIAGAGAAVAANEMIKDKTNTDPASALPQSAQDKLHENAKDSSLPQQAKSGNQTTTTDTSTTKTTSSSAPTDRKNDQQWSTTEKAAAGVGAVGVAAAGTTIAANELSKDKANTDPVGALPQSTQGTINNAAKDSSIPQQLGVSTADGVPQEVGDPRKEAGYALEAAGNPEAVKEKGEVENELLSKVPETNESGEPAPTASAAGATTVPATMSDTGAPQLGDPVGGGLEPIKLDEKSTTVPSTNGLNASADTPALPTAAAATTATAGSEGPTLLKYSAGGLDDKAAETSTSKAAETTDLDRTPGDSDITGDRHRDVTPFTNNGETQSPAVTTGVAESKTPATSTPQKPQSAVDKMKTYGTPESSSQASSPSTPTSKKEKRRSFFGRIKDKLKS